MARVDILIPAYNAARYLPAALDSVVAQTFEDWHIVLVDDGSTDRTPETVAPYIERLGSRLQYIRQENRGVSAARNNAIRSSSSELLALLDADDIWLPGRLEDSVRCFDHRPEVGLAYGLITQMDAEGKLLGTFQGNGRWAQGRLAPHIYMRKVQFPSTTITFRRKAVEEVGVFDESLQTTEDRDLWLRIAFRYEVAFVPKVIAYYRVSAQSLSSNPDRMLRAQKQFFRKHYGAPGCGFLERQIALGRAYKQRAEDLALRNQPWAALGSALQAFALCPFDTDNARTAASLLLKSSWIRRS